MGHKTILELQQEGRYAESGYGRLFAYNSLRFNAMIDARTKSKYIRTVNELNGDNTWDDTQKNILYSGPTVFLDKKKMFYDKKVIKADLISAYPSYLMNDNIEKPKIYRKLHKGAYPLSDRLALYVLQFQCDIDNMFAKWFLNSSAITMKKIKSGAGKVWGEIGIFSSKDMNLLQYVYKYLKKEEGRIIKTYTFYGDNTISANKEQIIKLFIQKENGNKNAKMELNASTGWLSHVDKATYYHMIQFIKFWLLETTYKNALENDLIGVQTDCLFYIETDDNKDVPEHLIKTDWSICRYGNKLGRFKFERVDGKDVITYNRRVELKDGS